ncbi:Kinase, NEK [Giardia muris]|uniref:Kinase, NEK n=1 Tax=Giardia muris TaxID=5742 RepID=A0A4Z1SMM8_GIAMU|nr:Kinase, NEK [Giardia muris]|eukprot:TNJ26944.1 Kinase, NEK [Giardia muris]
MSELIEAVRLGDLTEVRRKLGQAREVDDEGRTALMHAAIRGHAQIVRLLRSMEARLQDRRGWTALMYAIDSGRVECIRLLLLERDIKANNGETAIDFVDRYRGRDGTVGQEISRLVTQHIELPTLPEALRKYTLTGCLSSGGFGRIYTAHDAMDQLCLLKVVDYMKRPEVTQYLLTESQNLPQFQHQNILSYHTAYNDEEAKRMYFIMEWCMETLSDEVTYHKLPYTDVEVWHFLRDISAGLKYLHQKKLIHRDVKPDNIFILSDGLYVLGDFGLVCPESGTSMAHSNVGVPMYRAPELHLGQGYDSAIDIWALGLIAYTLLSGEPPFQDLREIGTKDPHPLNHCSIDLSELVQKMLTKNPTDRPKASEIYRLARDKIRFLKPVISTFANTSNRSLTSFLIPTPSTLDEKQPENSCRQERLTLTDSLYLSVIEPIQDVQDVRGVLVKTEKRIQNLRGVLFGLEEDLSVQSGIMQTQLNSLVDALNKTKREKRASEVETAFTGLLCLRARYDDKLRQQFSCADKKNDHMDSNASNPDDQVLSNRLQLRSFEHSLLRTNINLGLRRIDDYRRYIAILDALLELAHSQRSFPPVQKTDLAYEIKTLRRDMEETQAKINAATSRRK